MPKKECSFFNQVVVSGICCIAHLLSRWVRQNLAEIAKPFKPPVSSAMSMPETAPGDGLRNTLHL